MNSQTPDRTTAQEMKAMIDVVKNQKAEVQRLRSDGPEGKRIEKQRERIAELKELVTTEERRLDAMLGRIADSEKLIEGYNKRLQELQNALLMVQRRELIERMKKMHQELLELGYGNPAVVSEDAITS